MANRLSRLWQRYRRTRGLWRELLTVVLCALAGLIVVPCLIFAAGRLSLGAYAHGSLWSLWRDYVSGLAAGSRAFWFIALGPYLLVWLLRGGRSLLHN